jgi:hypothetical protein
VKRIRSDSAAAHTNRRVGELGDDLDVVTYANDFRRADEDPWEVSALEGDFALEAVRLRTVGISLAADVEQPQVGIVEQDRARAGGQNRPAAAHEFDDRFAESLTLDTERHRRRLASRQDQGVESVKVLGYANLAPISPDFTQRVEVIAEAALQR